MSLSFSLSPLSSACASRMTNIKDVSNNSTSTRAFVYSDKGFCR